MVLVGVRTWILAALVALGAAALYLPRLRDAPAYLNRDEMFFGLTAHAVATTGRDTTGRFLPLYFQSEMRYGSEMWFQPMLMYAATATVRLFGLSAGAIRLPMALAGIADVVLIFFVARLLFARDALALAAALLLAWSPAHFIQSRLAMDFQAPLPFVLGWLLCLLLYLRRGRPAMLVASGLALGIGLYTYIAAYMLMPLYLVLTCVALWRRHQPRVRYLLVFAGFLAPVLLGVPFLLQHPTVLHDVFWHYDRTRPLDSSAATLFAGFFSLERFARAADVYAGFWNPRFLFVNGPQSMWTAGAFLVVSAGLIAIGLARGLYERTPEAILLIGGLLTAAVPASLVGDGEAIHRAAAALPFGVLLAVGGLDTVWTAASRRVRIAAFTFAWAVVVVIAAAFHRQLPLAQAMIRAATVPLAIAGLSLLLRHSEGRLTSWRPAAAAVATAAIVLAASFLLGYTMVAWLAAALLVVIVVRLLSSDAVDRAPSDSLVAVVVAAATTLFVSAYIDLNGIGRAGFIPVSAIVMAARLVLVCGALAAAVAIARLAKALPIERLSGRATTIVVVAAIVVAQAVYFHLDRVVESPARLVLTAALPALFVAGVALFGHRAQAAHFGLGPLTAAAIAGVATIQFAYFYGDYFTRYRAMSGNFEPEGYTGTAWETVIASARERPVPAVYVADVGPYGFADLYWSFYAIEYRREDLLATTTYDVTFAPDRARQLPDGSLIVAGRSPAAERAIAEMATTGRLRRKTLVTAPDDRSMFWVLETGRDRATVVR